jgi:DNA-binding NarL/FixJ family response regulator
VTPRRASSRSKRSARRGSPISGTAGRTEVGARRARRRAAQAVRTVARGEALLAPAITQRLIERFVVRPPAAEAAPALAELGARELEVLRLLARGLSNAEIAAELIVGEATVKTHVARILRKLDVRDRVQAVVFAYESGLVEPGKRLIGACRFPAGAGSQRT